MLYPKSVRNFLLSLLLISTGAEAARSFSAWEEFDLDHALCERPIPLGIGRESFFEVANDVPGRDAYNRLVRLFLKRDWAELDAGIIEFQTEFESSPLRETVAFLSVQSDFDRDRKGDEEREKAAERKLRSTLLLYPKSELAPAISATAGSYWLRTGHAQRSLAIYELADKSHPNHALSCTYRLGIAESQFMLRNWLAADQAFDRVIKDCVNFRLRTAAKVRKVDIAWNMGKGGVEQAYEKIVFDDNPFIERFYQPALANLGELKYRAGKWDEAEHYFNRYLKTERAETNCAPLSMKRLADIAQRKGLKAAQVIGRYLAVHKRSPTTDVGRFSYAHALFADPGLIPGPELDRRIRLVDAEVDKITDEDLRSRVFVEKGITLLELGEASAMDYLGKVKGKTRYDIKAGKAGRFIRSQFVKLMESGRFASLESPNVFVVLEEGYHDWLEGTEEAKWAPEFYGRILATQVEKLAASGKVSDAIERLKRWTHSPLWPKGEVPKQIRSRIGSAMLAAVYHDGIDGGSSLAVTEARSSLEPILSPDYRIVTWLAGLMLKTKESKGGWLKWERELASASKGMSPDEVPLFRLSSALGLRLQGDYTGAEAALKGLSDRKWDGAIRRERIQLARAQGQGDLAYSLLNDELKVTPSAEKKTVLKEMAQWVEQTRLWSRGDDLLNQAKAVLSDKEELGEYYHLAGRAMSESSKCSQAIPYLESALRMSTSKRTAESRFRLAKCLASQRNPTAARQEWQRVVDMQDSFWSPLASSEIKLLTP